MAINSTVWMIAVHLRWLHAGYGATQAVQQPCIGCTRIIVNPHSTVGVPSLYSRCTVGVPSACSQCAVSVQSVCSQCTVGVQSAYSQCLHMPTNMSVYRIHTRLHALSARRRCRCTELLGHGSISTDATWASTTTSSKFRTTGSSTTKKTFCAGHRRSGHVAVVYSSGAQHIFAAPGAVPLP